MYYTVIKHSSHSRTLEKCRKHSPTARAFHISLVFSNACRVLSQCNTRLRLLYLLNRSLVTPYLTYGLTAWGQAYKSYLEKLLKLQKRALRFIYFSERNQHSIPLLIDAGVLPLNFLYYELLANLLFEIRHRNAPGNIQDLFQDISDIYSYNTRSSVLNNFYTQSSRLSIQVNSFSRIGTKIWNEMPMSLRKLPKTVFKRKIKQTLFEILASEDYYIDLPLIIQKVKLNLFSS